MKKGARGIKFLRWFLPFICAKISLVAWGFCPCFCLPLGSLARCPCSALRGLFAVRLGWCGVRPLAGLGFGCRLGSGSPLLWWWVSASCLWGGVSCPCPVVFGGLLCLCSVRSRFRLAAVWSVRCGACACFSWFPHCWRFSALVVGLSRCLPLRVGAAFCWES